MGVYLLDTHTAIWYLTGDALLSPTAKRIINDRTNRVYLSVVSAWELSIKISIGKLRFPGNAAFPHSLLKMFYTIHDSVCVNHNRLVIDTVDLLRMLAVTAFWVIVIETLNCGSIQSLTQRTENPKSLR
jgi:hypothetical protein